MSTRVKSPGKARAKSPGKARAKSPRPPKVVPKPAPKPKAAPKPRAAPRPPRAKSPAATATGGRKPAGSNGAVGAGAAASRVFAAPLVSLRPFTCSHDGCTDRFMNQAQLVQHEQQAHRGGKPRRVTLLFNVPAVIFPFYSDEPPAAVRSRAAPTAAGSQPAGMGGRVMSSASHHRFTVLASQHAAHYPAPRPAMPPPPPPSAAMFRFGGVQGGGGGSASATHWWAAGR
jgi:hypothetical protein